MSALMVAAAAAFALQATAGVPSTAPPQQVWDLEWESPHCTISTGNEKDVALSFWMAPGDPDPQIYLIGSTARLPSGDKPINLTLLPGGATYQPQVETGLNTAGQRILRLTKLRERFPGAFANSNAMRLTSGDTTIAIPVTGAGAAVAAIKECIDAKLPEWGVDAKAYDALQMPPTDIEGHSWFTVDDYPRQAMDNNETGTVVDRMAVDSTGKVTDCHVVVSRSPFLDDATCRVARSRGRFNPAIGADGRPTAAQRIVVFVFRLSP